MKNKKVISHENLPAPTIDNLLNTGLLWYLIAAYFAWPGWAHGILWTLYGIICIGTVCRWFLDDYVEVLK